MSRWRVILAAMVIFAAGAVTGGFAVRGTPKNAQKTQVTPPLPVNPDRREDYLSRLDRELQLTPEQRTKIEGILAGSQERMKALWKSIEPNTKEEYQRTRKEISEVLTPEQREKKKQMRHNKGEKSEKTGERKPQACLRPKCKAC